MKNLKKYEDWLFEEGNAQMGITSIDNPGGYIYNPVGEEEDESNYMFFSNLKRIKQLADMILKLDQKSIDDMLNNGHDWANSHVNTAKTNLDHVFEFFNTELKGVSESHKVSDFERKYAMDPVWWSAWREENEKDKKLDIKKDAFSKTYEVKDEDGQVVAIFYTDFFPRKGQRNGAWMTSFKSQYINKGVNERPHISNVCNFTPPIAASEKSEAKPSLLTFNEVTTLFHEFGHGLHGMLANTTYPSLSGTSVYWDFVELPSQIMENWCYEPEALALFAYHYETGEMIPMELVHKIKESASFQEGMATMRQLSFGLLDMVWHGQYPSNIKDIKTFENDQFAATQLYPEVKENAMSTSFSHIFQGGYSSGYYSYKWAEVLDADAFEYFQEKGIFNKEVATKFKENILSKGGTEHPMILYKRFRGQEPKPEALLKRAGLL